MIKTETGYEHSDLTLLMKMDGMSTELQYQVRNKNEFPDGISCIAIKREKEKETGEYKKKNYIAQRMSERASRKLI